MRVSYERPVPQYQPQKLYLAHSTTPYDLFTRPEHQYTKQTYGSRNANLMTKLREFQMKSLLEQNNTVDKILSAGSAPQNSDTPDAPTSKPSAPSELEPSTPSTDSSYDTPCGSTDSSYHTASTPSTDSAYYTGTPTVSPTTPTSVPFSYTGTPSTPASSESSQSVRYPSIPSASSTDSVHYPSISSDSSVHSPSIPGGNQRPFLAPLVIPIFGFNDELNVSRFVPPTRTPPRTSPSSGFPLPTYSANPQYESLPAYQEYVQREGSARILSFEDWRSRDWATRRSASAVTLTNDANSRATNSTESLDRRFGIQDVIMQPLSTTTTSTGIHDITMSPVSPPPHYTSPIRTTRPQRQAAAAANRRLAEQGLQAQRTSRSGALRSAQSSSTGNSLYRA